MRIIIGRIGRPHGIRGEVVIGLRTDEPDLRFAVGAAVDVSSVEVVDCAALEQLTVASVRWHSGQLVVTFAVSEVENFENHEMGSTPTIARSAFTAPNCRWNMPFHASAVTYDGTAHGKMRRTR